MSGGKKKKNSLSGGKMPEWWLGLTSVGRALRCYYNNIYGKIALYPGSLVEEEKSLVGGEITKF